MNEAKAKSAEKEKEKELERLEYKESEIPTYNFSPQSHLPFDSDLENTPRVSTIKLKGVELPKFSGDDKNDFESRKAAFTAVVDKPKMPVSEKMLRLQNSLTGKALKLVKVLGFTLSAYERAMETLERRYGGDRRVQIKHQTSLRAWPKVRHQNLEDLEGFVDVLDRVLVSTKDRGLVRGDVTDQNLNLMAKEKLPEIGVQEYKMWLYENSKEDTFETLDHWVELRVQIMDEAGEETVVELTGKRSTEKGYDKYGNRRTRGYSNKSRSRN